MDFEPQAYTEYKELAQKLLELIPQVFPKRKKKKKERERDQTEIHQCKQRSDGSILDYYERFEKNF